jgi:excisionase family DNA binding protein
MVLEGLLALAEDPKALAEVRPALRLILGIDDPQGDAPLQTTAAAAARLGVHHRTVERMARDGRLPGAVKVGSAWRIPADALPNAVLQAVDDLPVAAAPERGSRRGRSAPAPRTDGSAESAMDAVITGRMRRTPPQRSAPASAGTDRGRGPTEKDSMDMQQRSAARTGGATVTPIMKGSTR